jgi:hypothetical protein
MKLWLFILCVSFLPSLGMAQVFPISFSEVVIVDSTLDKNHLFSSGRSWFNNSFRDSKEVLQIQDKESGELSGKGLFTYSPNAFALSACTKGTIRFTVSIHVKDGRYKYVLSDFIHEGTESRLHAPVSFGLITSAQEINIECFDCYGKKWEQELWNHIKSEIYRQVQPLIASLKIDMEKNAKDDW